MIQLNSRYDLSYKGRITVICFNCKLGPLVNCWMRRNRWCTIYL